MAGQKAGLELLAPRHRSTSLQPGWESGHRLRELEAIQLAGLDTRAVWVRQARVVSMVCLSVFRATTGRDDMSGLTRITVGGSSRACSLRICLK